MNELNNEKQIIPTVPKILGGLLVVPKEIIDNKGDTAEILNVDFESRKVIEETAMKAVIENEINLGYEPQDVSSQNLGCDILSFDRTRNKHRFIEVKGKSFDKREVTVSKNEIICGLNKKEDYALAIVYVKEKVLKSQFIVGILLT